MAERRRALLSTYDKTGVVDLAKVLVRAGWELLSSGGTAAVLAEAGITVQPLAELTGFGEMLSHRVVTLHPAVHGALLADRDDPTHLADLAEHGIEPIDLVVVNLYPFASDPGIELIDIGGPTMVRAAAKNHAHVGVVVNPAAWTHTSVAIRDALVASELPVIEVHLSNVHAREPFRHHSFVSPVATAVMAGFGSHGYRLALEHFGQRLQR